MLVRNVEYILCEIQISIECTHFITEYLFNVYNVFVHNCCIHNTPSSNICIVISVETAGGT